MNSNNYIRKIDDLGRIVIPKEVRTKLKIGENENILISCDDKKINITKYSYLDNYHSFIFGLAEALAEIYKYEIVVFDRDKQIYSNYRNCFSYYQTEDIIKDSIMIGKITVYSNTKEDLLKLTKLLSKIMTIFLST